MIDIDHCDSFFGLFFELTPKPGHLQHYFDHVAHLKPILTEHDGLKWLHRYRQEDDANRILSHQLWDSESSILRWRRDSAHKRSQQAGIKTHFADYRIRVGRRIWHNEQNVITGTLPMSPQTPLILTVYHATIDRLAGGNNLWSHGRRYINMLDPDSAVTLLDFDPNILSVEQLATALTGCTASIFAINRDYGMFDRVEAPKAR